MERRKLIMRNIPFRCGVDDVEAWVRRRLGDAIASFEDIQLYVERHRNSSAPRAYAVFTIMTYDPASYLINKMHNKVCRGRQVSVSLAWDDGGAAPRGMHKNDVKRLEAAVGAASIGASNTKTSTVSKEADLDARPLVVHGCGHYPWTGQ